MINLAISEDLNLILEQAADRTGQTKDEYLEDLIRSRADDQSLPLSAFTDQQLSRLKKGFAQVERGECTVTSEQVDAKFERFFQELESR